MCLAVPAQIVECTGDEALVDLQGSRLRISRVLTPEAGVGDWVLVHAGFAITRIDAAAASETWDYLRQALADVPPGDLNADDQSQPRIDGAGA